MKTLLMTAATALILSTGAYAQTATMATEQPTAEATSDVYVHEREGYMAMPGEELTAEALTGARIYSETDEDIGEVSEIILSGEGKVEAVMLDIGGFMGIGEEPVRVALNDISILREDGGDDVRVYLDTAAVATVNPDGTVNAEGEVQQAANDTATAVENAAAATVAAATEAANDTAAAVDNAVDATAAAAADATDGMENTFTHERDGYMGLAADQLTAETLTGARVYSTDDRDIGEISDVVLNTDGSVDAVIVDVGGFLGIGEKPVAVKMSMLSILKQEGGDDIRVYVDATEDSLEAMPAFES